MIGRGPLAGPVVACAVVFRRGYQLEGLNDSKKLSPKRRAKFCEEILAGAESVNWAFVSESTIDDLNIYRQLVRQWKKKLLKVYPWLRRLF